MSTEQFFKNIESLKLLAKKEVGQNFLIDPVVCEKIVSLLTASEKDSILEIGCGAGSLSYFLSFLKSNVDLIDIDEGLLVKVSEDFKNCQNIHPKRGNAMDYDYSTYTKIVGNLPYYITSGIIEKVVLGALKCEKAVFMVQKEAAQRLLAPVGDENCTPLTLLLNYLCNVTKVFNVGRNSFVPVPHVESTVIQLEFCRERQNQDTFAAYNLAKTLFLNKRKTILNNLKNNFPKVIPYTEVLKEAGIVESLRPQAINFEKFISLYSVLKKY